MALFALWLDGAEDGANLPIDAHIVPERAITRRFETPQGVWRLSAFACASHFYTADAQIRIDPDGGACVIHGLIWRTGEAALLDAAAVAAWLDAPGARLPDDVAGEYAVVRLYPDGTLEAFGDPAGLHQIFLDGEGLPIVANRASFVAALAGRRQPDRDSALWLGTIGYRLGTRSGWDDVHQLEQGAVLRMDASGVRIDRSPLVLSPSRGFDSGLLAEGLVQAQAAIRLAAADDLLDLPITGGKDSRVVLAIALAAGFRDRLSLFTRGYAGHPDVAVGEMIAASINVPHRREPPLGSDLPADLGPQAFLARLRAIAFQTDGGMGGWDNVAASAIGRSTIVSGHFGEVLKAYAKRAPAGPLDPAGMVRLQAPFDPLEVLRPPARARLTAALQSQMDDARATGAEEADLPDIFYWRNRVPNWLGGIRGVKSFERQPVLPLGVPALMRLAFRMTAAERKAELAHYRLIETAAPELLDLPFAHQSWHPSLGAKAVPPVLAAADAPLFGSWQWSVNRVPGVRAALAQLFASAEIPLWEDVDRARLIDLLHQRRFDYFDLISLLGFAVAAIHQAGLALPVRLGEEEATLPPDPAAPVVAGHVDQVRIAGDRAEISGWAWAPDWPGAAVAAEARLDGRVVAVAAADQNRPDLAAAGIGEGRHGFTIRFEAGLLEGAHRLVVAGVGCSDALVGGERALDQQLPRDA